MVTRNNNTNIKTKEVHHHDKNPNFRITFTWPGRKKLITQIFVNLPVKHLNKTAEFFTKLGFTFNPKFTDENATCLIVNNGIFVMLLVEKFFKTFTKREICDTTKATEVIIALSTESRENVDQMINKVI